MSNETTLLVKDSTRLSNETTGLFNAKDTNSPRILDIQQAFIMVLNHQLRIPFTESRFVLRNYHCTCILWATRESGRKTHQEIHLHHTPHRTRLEDTSPLGIATHPRSLKYAQNTLSIRRKFVRYAVDISQVRREYARLAYCIRNYLCSAAYCLRKSYASQSHMQWMR